MPICFSYFSFSPPASPICRQGTAGKCRKAKYVPGSQLAGRGFNIIDLTQQIPFHREIASRVCTLCENPLQKGKPFQMLPFFINKWEANILCQQKVQHSIHHSAISLAEALTELQVKNDWRYDLDVKFNSSDKVQRALAGSHSRMTERCVEKRDEEKYIILLLHITCSYYKFSVSKDLLRSDYFKASINSLPPKHNASSNEYFRLIDHYGTHWVKEFHAGARMTKVSYIAECSLWLEGLSISEITRCLELDLGIIFGLDGLTNSTQLHACREMLKKYYPKGHLEITEIGGSFYPDYLFPPHDAKAWLARTKSSPGLVSSSIEPLYTLLDKSDPKRDELKKALIDYMRDRALWWNCTKPCPPGTHPSASDFCYCECPSNNFTNSRCCPHKRGLSKLMVTIEYAQYLWGDIITRSDAYVSVSFQNRKMCTHTVWNNNNPTWNVTFNFGIIKLNEYFNMLRVEVWDEDSGWDDDRLGHCEVVLAQNQNFQRTCYMNHADGRLHFRYRLVCGPNLIGATCWDYLSDRHYREYETPDYYH